MNMERVVVTLMRSLSHQLNAMNLLNSVATSCDQHGRIADTLKDVMWFLDTCICKLHYLGFLHVKTDFV